MYLDCDDPCKKWRARPMKTCCALGLAVGLGCTAIADVSVSQAQDFGYISLPSCSATHSSCISDSTSFPSNNIKIADDYCHTRCEQKFNYCQYRSEPIDRCIDRLATCRARC